MKAKITYASGLITEVQTEHTTIEAFVNEHFGSTWEEAQANGASVELTEFSPVGATELQPPGEPQPSVATVINPEGEAHGNPDNQSSQSTAEV